MKRIPIILAGLLAVMCLFGGCSDPSLVTHRLDFPAYGVTVSFQADKAWYVACDDSAFYIGENAEAIRKGNCYGMLNLSNVGNTYDDAAHCLQTARSPINPKEYTVEVFGEKSCFDIYDGTSPKGVRNPMFGSVYYDRERGVALFGRYFPSEIDRDTARVFAKSISFQPLS